MRDLRFVALLVIISVLCLRGYALRNATTSYTSTDELIGNWSDDDIWVGGSAPSNTPSNNTVITITGSITINASLNLNNNNTLLIESEDTLVVNGDVNVDNNSFIGVDDNAVLIVLGSFSSSNNLDIAATGKVIVFENFEVAKGTTINIPSSNNLYIFGTATIPSSTTFPNSNDIGTQESFISGESELTEWLDDNYNTELPIQLVSFTVFTTPRGIEFSWITESEDNNDFFTLEFSQNGIDFFPIATIPGAGNTSTKHAYTYFDDSKKHTGLVYFRLKQTDYNGKHSYSEILSISIPNYNTDVFIYPNPVSDYFYIHDNNNTIIQVRFFNSLFEEIQIEHDNSIYVVYGLEKGTYFVQIQTETIRFVTKFIKK
ncbi:MAG: T9SS type A sorting domain-containing protein [Bacteroidales bacterium]|jgi:hypothetical protein|nr:T9SS type A sorting domain-containing protein [Bacteroidales bacterium]